MRTVTIAAIACCAFALTDVTHESLGHGGAYALLGGRSFILTTTRMIANGPGIHDGLLFPGNRSGELYGRIFSIAGPMASFFLATLCLAWLGRFEARTGSAARLFLWLTSGFSLCWACGYMISSSLFGYGDYFSFLQNSVYEQTGRVLFVVAGCLLYVRSIRLLGTSVGEMRAFVRVAYVSAAIVAIIAAALDPRGVGCVLRDAIPATLLANAGMLFLARGSVGTNGSIPGWHPAWIAAGILVGLVYILFLGPGLQVRL